MIEEVKRIGKNVYVNFFFEAGLNDELHLAADDCVDLTSNFVISWREYREEHKDAR